MNQIKLAAILTLATASLTIGCNNKPAPATASPAAKPAVMNAAGRATAAKAAREHPGFKVFLQKIDMPAIIVVPPDTSDDKLKNLLWFLRTQVRTGKFKTLGLQPTATLFDQPEYSSGVINIYRGTRCAKEMYITNGPDPCGASIHKSASYHWGEGGDRTADGGDIVMPGGADVLLFRADDGWQTDDEARDDPTGALHKAYVARIQFATKQNARASAMYQGSDMRFAVTDPVDRLHIVSYQLATEDGRKSLLKQFLILEQDDLCRLGFKSIKLGTRGTPGKSYPLTCSATK